MSDELIEKVAKALAECDHEIGFGMASSTPEEFKDFASAALKAINASGTHVVARRVDLALTEYMRERMEGIE